MLAASVWVGGQITLAALVPVVRRIDPDAVGPIARRFQIVAWSAFAVVIGTGIWNLLAVNPGDQTLEWQTTLIVKLALVAVSGICAALHSFVIGPRIAHINDARAQQRGRILNGVLAIVALLAAVSAVFLGVALD